MDCIFQFNGTILRYYLMKIDKYCGPKKLLYAYTSYISRNILTLFQTSITILPPHPSIAYPPPFPTPFTAAQSSFIKPGCPNRELSGRRWNCSSMSISQLRLLRLHLFGSEFSSTLTSLIESHMPIGMFGPTQPSHINFQKFYHGSWQMVLNFRHCHE